MPTHRRRHRRPHPVLDLHGLNREYAVVRVQRWLERAHVEDVRTGVILCGWGKGVLLKAIGDLLESHPLVADHRRNGPRFVVEIVPREPDPIP